MRRSLVLGFVALAGCYNPDAKSGDAGSTTDGTSATDPSATDPSATDPSATDPSATDPSATDPSATDPSATDPSATDPSDTDPSDTSPTSDPTDSSASVSVSDSDPDGSGSTDGTTDEPATTTEVGPVACNPVGDDCGAGEYCNAPDCVTIGVCAASPASTSGTMAPACGCDDTSYWNVEHAHWLGATAFTTGDAQGCGNAATSCLGDGDCDTPGSACVTENGLGAGSCGGGTSGRCWAIPANADCSMTPPLPDVGFGSCATGPNQCNASALDYCEALIDGDFFAICI